MLSHPFPLWTSPLGSIGYNGLPRLFMVSTEEEVPHRAEYHPDAERESPSNYRSERQPDQNTSPHGQRRDSLQHDDGQTTPKGSSRFGGKFDKGHGILVGCAAARFAASSTPRADGFRAGLLQIFLMMRTRPRTIQDFFDNSDEVSRDRIRRIPNQCFLGHRMSLFRLSREKQC